MPEGEEKKVRSLFDVKATESAQTVSSTETPLAVEQESSTQKTGAKSLFDIKNTTEPSPALKKKEQPELKSPSTSDLGGSTSGLGGTTSVAQPNQTDFPTIQLSDQELGIQTPIPQLQQADIDAIDFQSIAEQPQDSVTDTPKIKSVKDLKVGARKSQKIENIIRRNVVANPSILDLEGFDDAVLKKIQAETGDEGLAKDALESLKTLRREQSVLNTESQTSLDVTPDFNTAQIMSNINKSSVEMNKQNLIAGGKSEKEAEDISNLLFPEPEVLKSAELGLNINKVKDDYMSFLLKNNPEKLKDITSSQKVGNFKGAREMSFMQEALSHQSEIVDAKVNAILSKKQEQITKAEVERIKDIESSINAIKSKGQENLTQDDVDQINKMIAEYNPLIKKSSSQGFSEEDINTIEALENQRSRLGERFKTAINDFPELREKAVNDRIAQERVDESYKKAKANVLLSGWDGTKAKAEVLYHQVVSPVLGSAVKMVGDVAQLGINQQRGMSDDEAIKGASGIMGDWVTGFFDTEKSSSIYKKPSELKGSLFENGDLKAERLVPKVSETLFQMYALLGGGGAAGSALETAGLGANISQKLGLITSSYVITQNDYFQEAKSLGLSDKEANNFGNAASLLTSTLELINPQRHIFGKEGKKAFTKEVVNAIGKGVDMKTAIKQNANFVAKEIIGENAQEFAQTAGDLSIKYLFNKKNGTEDFDVNVTQDELMELVLLTSIVSGGGSVHGVKSRSGLEKESLYRATQDIDKFKRFLENPENEKDFTPQELAGVSEKVTEYKKVVDGLPKNLDENSKVELANLVYQKKKLNESKKEVFVDETVSSKAGNDIDTQINEINGQIELVFDEQKETNIDKKIIDLELETDGDVEYKVGDQFLSEKEIIGQLNNEVFTKAVKDGETDLSISNPSPEVAQALEQSGLLTNTQLETIKPKENVEETKTEKPETKGEEAVLETSTETATPVVEDTKVLEPKKTEVETFIEIPKSKTDKIAKLGFTEEVIGELTEGQVDTIINDKIEFTDDLDIKSIKEPVIGKAKIAEGFDELLSAIGGKANITPNMFNKPSAFNALKKIAEGVVEETGLQGQKLIDEIKVRLKAALGDKFQESDIDDIAAEITEHAKTVKPTKKETTKEEAPKKETPKKVEKKAETPKTEIKTEKPKGEEQSGFQKRTLEQAEGSPAKEQVKRVVEENQQFYKVMNIAETVEAASKNIEKEGGFNKAYERLITEKVGIDELAVLQIERQLALDFYGNELDLAVKDGRKADADKAYKRVDALQDAISRDGTKAGQSIAMLQLWRALRPDGTVEFMNRKINAHNESVRKSKPLNSKETVGETIDNFQNFIKDLTTEQIGEILDSPKGKSIIDKIVSQNKPNIKNELEAKLKRRKAKVDSVVARLDALKIKDDKALGLLPFVNFAPAIWNGSIEVIKKSIQAGETMASAIEKAVAYIKSNIGEDEDFNESAYRNHFAEEKKSLDTDAEVSLEIDKALNEIGTSIKDVINKHYTEKDELGRTLAQKLIEEAGISKDEANKMATLIQNELNKKIRDQAEKKLSQALGVTRLPVTRKVKKLADDLLEKINLGALDTEFFNGLFAEKFKLAKPLTPEQRIELKRLADIVSKQEAGSTFEANAMMDMLRFMDSLYPKNNRTNTFFSLFYASLLSGMSTSALNLWSAGSNIGLKPIRDVLNVSKWIMAGRKGLESGSIKDFLAYAPFNDMFYMPAAISHAVALGRKEFAEVWKNGDVDSKFIEQVANKEFSKLNPLERERYGKHAFKPINLNIAGKKISINPFNYYKYSGRNLAAQDKLMFRVSKDIELVSIIREQQLDNGLRGEELRKAVIDEYTQRNVDMDSVMEKLNKEISELEKDTGKKITKRQKAIRLRQILESGIDTETIETAEEVGRGNIFTDQRGGLIATMAANIGKLSNSNAAMALVLKPWVPFTRIVGNVSEYMMDTIPIYGQMRAQGLGVTNLAKMYGGKTLKDINSSQMGSPGTKAYYEQMGRAWLGTAAFITALATLLGSDEDDEVFITGGYEPDKFKRGRENATPKYTLSIKGFEVPYLNIPGIAIPLAAIGNYNDRLRFGDDKDESNPDRIWNTMLATVGTFKDMSFLQGVQDLTEMMSAVMSGKESETKRLGKDLYKKYFLTITKPLPQNFNLIDQIEKIYDPTSWSQGDIKDLTMYGLGIQRFVNNPSLDIFGESIKSLPGQTLLPYDHWLGLKGKDERWKFLSKYNAIQNKVSGNQDIDFMDQDFEIERRKPEKEELFEYTKLAGEKFSEKLNEYISEGVAEERSKEEALRGGKKITGAQADINNLWSEAKFEARDELFSK